MSRTGWSNDTVAGIRGIVAGAMVVCWLSMPAAGADAQPATVAEAAKVLDLSKLPVVEGATEFGYRTLAWLYYKAPADVKTAYGFHLKQLTGDGWREQPNSQVMNESASATLQRDGYTISPSASASGEEKSCQVMIVNHGNVDLAKVVAPAKSKPFYAFPSVAAHITEVPLEETTETVKKLLLDAGWVPYGESPGLWSFKKNAVLLKASISTAPAQDNKTVVTYSSELMSADLPAPESAEGIEYYDQLMRLMFETKQPANEVVAFYRDALQKLGWEPATDKPIEDNNTLSMYFNSKPQGRLSLDVTAGTEKSRVELKRQTPEQLAEIERLIAEEKKKPRPVPTPTPKPETPVVKLKLPTGAKNVETEEDSIKFVVAAGKAKAAAEAFRKTLKAAGWQEDVASLEKEGGTVSLSKDDASITIVYIDIGFSPADVSVSGFRVNLKKE